MRAANGYASPTSHREDCHTGADCPVNNFGDSQDLAIVFDPAAGGPSPVTVTATFSSPFPNLKFEISDIDFSESGSTPGQHRLDRVKITSPDAGDPMSITPKNDVGPYTFVTPIIGNTVTAKCTGTQPACSPSDTTAAVPAEGNNPNPDSGTVIVKFGATPVSAVTITYTEAGNGTDPTGRGIAVLANLTPVELMSFTVD